MLLIWGHCSFIHYIKNHEKKSFINGSVNTADKTSYCVKVAMPAY